MSALTGSTWEADLFWAPGVVTDSTLLVALKQPATFATVPTQAGLFFGGTRTIPGASAATSITAQIRVWDTADGSSWAAAAASTSPTARIGESILLQVRLTDPLDQLPTELVGLNGHPWNVHFVSAPEPSTVALAGLGLAGRLIVRRRR